MLKLNRNQKREPIGGHQFVERSITFKGDTFDEVVEKIRDFRITNCLPVGDPEQEVLIHYVKNWPYMVTDDKGATWGTENLMFMAWRKWISDTWRTPPKKMVTTKEAVPRWEKCRSCPHNKKLDWEETDESSELKRRAFILRKGIDAPTDIGFCALHSADLGVITFIDNARDFSQKPKDKGDYPSCWIL